ncbi:hypothetical protein [Saccharothrix xinjiangensis]|uniref:ABC transporter permease n=1 Tax=Saccharothrix xinjiangensis TaxID=204798 RepID=A0ABV9XUR4_9PSEU
MAEPSAAGLLDELSRLRKRARIARRGHWLPVVVIGLLTLGAVPFYRPVEQQCPPGERSCAVLDHGTSFTVPGLGRVDPLGVFNAGNFFQLANPLALGAYWVLALLTGLVVTVWWYRRRAEVAGLETSTSAYVRVTLGGFAVVLGIALVGGLLPAEVRRHLRHDIKVEMVEAAVFLALPVVLAILSERDFARTRWYRAAVVAGFVATSVLGAVAVTKTGGLMLFAAGLLVLAWLERSPWCALVALGYAGFTLLANASTMGQVFWDLGWRPDSRVDVLFSAKDVLFPGCVAVVGGLVALALSRVRR